MSPKRAQIPNPAGRLVGHPADIPRRASLPNIEVNDTTYCDVSVVPRRRTSLLTCASWGNSSPASRTVIVVAGFDSA